ncbi:MAG: cytochrome P450 [Gammaproteobacteria bacterium]|nr:cytochrome P450 [Gammaproteobacteria bacterium]MYG13970.1 cytochrome P450 [Gammaproteobacteria bacterium]MYK27750.1 cytochrome P450 [Gammaproteobacteria bacterium]
MKCPVTLADVDLFGPGAPEHWYEAYEILHREAPVHCLPGEGPTPDKDAFVLTKYDDIALVVRDPVRFPPLITMGLKQLNESGASPEDVPNLNTMMASMMTLRPTNELYRSHRQELTDPWVGPGASRNTEMITGHVNELIENWIDNDPGEVEFISEFARPLPQRVMNSILGFPQEDIALVEKWGAAQVAPFVYGEGHRNLLSDEQIGEQFEALDEFADYVQAHIEDRRRRPKDDMITFLTQVTYQALGRKLTDLEINGIVYAMVIGGLETTQYAIEEQAQLLCERDGVFDAIKQDRSRLRHFTEEGMRLRSPTQGLSTRITTQDEVFQGVTVPAGSQLHLRWAAGNIDEEEFECPHELQLDRKAVSRHLTFSQGPRVCPGAHLSRLEQVIAWDRLLDSIDHLEYAPGNTFLHQPGIMLGTLELKLRFTKAA